MIPVAQALDKILSFARPFTAEEISLDIAAGRVLAEDIFTDRDYPPFNRSAMDGIALRAEELNKQKEFLIEHEIFAGKEFKGKISNGACVKIMTGAPVPPDADAVVRIEDCEVNGKKVKINLSEVLPWANISRQGEDCRKGTMALKKGTLCNAPVTGLLSALGKHKIFVYKLPSVAVYSTGDEIKKADEEVLPFQIRDSNSYALRNFFLSYEIKIREPLILKDDKEELKKGIRNALASDIIILTGGVSMGDADYVPSILKELGIEEIFYKVSVKPGKPLWFGAIQNKVIFALPGNPMSCQVAFKVFIEPFLRKCMSMTEQRKIFLPLASLKKKKTKLTEYFPCRIVNSLGKTFLEPVKINGSGDITSTVYSDGIAIHPENAEELQEGTVVEFILWM
jgi:molybdopterin molybdotransferase